jgi:hypothetical protein
VTTLLPTHLPPHALHIRRHIRFAGSTLATSSIFDAIAYVLKHPISVTYETGTDDTEQEQLGAGARAGARSKKETAPQDPGPGVGIGFGGWDLTVGQDLDQRARGQRQSRVENVEDAVVHLGRDLEMELKPKGWAEVVWEFFATKRGVRTLNEHVSGPSDMDYPSPRHICDE